MLKTSVMMKSVTPGGEDRLITNAAVWQIAETHLHDECGDRGGRLARIDSQVGLHAGGNRHDHRFANSA